MNAWSQNDSKFDQHEAFAPLFYPSFGDEVRAADGTPGPKYWQIVPIIKSMPRLMIHQLLGMWLLLIPTIARNLYLLFGCS